MDKNEKNQNEIIEENLKVSELALSRRKRRRKTGW